MRPDRARPPGDSGPRQAVTPARGRTTAPPPVRAEAIHIVASGTGRVRACEAPGCGGDLPRGRRRFCSDLCRQRGQRAERRTETSDFGQMVVRMIGTMARRVGGSDIAAFGALWEVRAAADQACAAAIDGLRAKGFSWAQIAAEAGQSRQGLTQWRQRRDAQFGGNDLLRREVP
jgi:hypothetical protein